MAEAKAKLDAFCANHAHVAPGTPDEVIRNRLASQYVAVCRAHGIEPE